MTVIEEVAAERARQMEREGWTVEHDDKHADAELAQAAAAYCESAYRETIGSDARGIPGFWPWDESWWKPKGARRDLIRAAALIVAEIERLDRADAVLAINRQPEGGP